MDNIADEIKSKCNIVDVIGKAVTLKKKGTNYVGLCPFHREKTPSFMVSEERQSFTCYGCGAKGDVFSFIQQTQNLSFVEAAEKLADEYGLKWTGVRGSGGNKDLYYEVNKIAARFFFDTLRKRRGKALHYIAKRGITAETIKKFGIGHADEEWDSLYKHLLEKDIDVRLMTELGLISQSKDKCFDKFRDRIMFPILNTRGKVIAFGGRTLGGDRAKYLNSQDSGIFHKKNNLYALNTTRHDIVKADQVILVEGYMDVISLYQHGVRHVTASLGTALTAEQAVIIKRYTNNAVIAYDSDSAGIVAAQRGIDLLIDAGCSVKVLRLTEAKDPDEYICSKGREQFLELVKEAPTHIRFRLDLLKEQYNINETEGRLKFLKEAARILKTLSPVEAEIYIKTTAEETRMPEGALRTEITGLASQKERREARRSVSDAGRLKIDSASQEAATRGNMLERNFIRLILHDSKYYLKIKSYEHVFITAAIQRIYGCIAAIYDDDNELDQKKLEDSLEAEDRAVLAHIRENIIISNREEAVFAECIRSIKLKSLADQETDMIELLKTVDVDNQEDKGRIIKLTEELIRIQKEIKKIKEVKAVKEVKEVEGG